MLAFIVALAFPAAGIAAIAAIALTVRTQTPALRQLFVESRNLQRDREFLAVMIATPTASAFGLGEISVAANPVRSVSRKPVRRMAALAPAQLRAAA